MKDATRIAYIVEQKQELLVMPIKVGKKYDHLAFYCMALIKNNDADDLRFICDCIQLVINKGYISLLMGRMNDGVYTFLESILFQPANHPLHQIIYHSEYNCTLGISVALSDALVSIDKVNLT